MTIDNKIRDEKLRYDINREVAKISALSFEQIDKNEYLTGKEVLPSDKRRVIEQTKFTQSPLGKVLTKKAIENHGKTLIESNFLERILILKEIAYHLNKKVYLMNLLKKGLQNLEIEKKQLILVI